MKLTVRVTEEERRRIEQYAKEENKNMNRYLIDKALNRGHGDENDRLKCNIMKDICWLNQTVQDAVFRRKYSQIPAIVSRQGHHIAKLLEE